MFICGLYVMQYSKSFVLLALLFVLSSQTSVTLIFDSKVNNETSLQESEKNVKENKSKESIVNLNNTKNDKSLKNVMTYLKPEDNFDGDSNETKKKDFKFLKKKNENESNVEDKPFIVFPFFPFLFPEEKNENAIDTNIQDIYKDKEGDNKEKNNEEKPIIFVDLELNIRKIPFAGNGSKPLNDTTIIYTENFITDKSSEDGTNKDISREWEKAKAEIEKPINAMFDDFPLFPDWDEDIFQKSDMFLSEIPSRRKSAKKLRRKKRERHSDLGSNLKFFVNSLFETFSKSKRDVEKDGSELNVNENKHEKKTKKSVSTNLKRRSKQEFRKKNVHVLNSMVKPRDLFADEDNNSSKGKIIQIRQTEQKAVKISNKEKFKKLGNSTKLRRKYFSQQVKGETKFPLKEKKDKRKVEFVKMNQTEEKPFTKVQSKEIEIIPETNVSFTPPIIDSDVTSEDNPIANETDFIALLQSNIQDFNKISEKLPLVNAQKKRKVINRNLNKKLYYEKLKNNVSDVLTRFLVLVKKLENDSNWTAPLLGSKEVETEEPTKIEEKTPLSPSVFKRNKKQVNFFQSFIDFTDSDRHLVVDFNYLFLTVTLPTTFALSILLLICFFNLQVKGKICTSLFKRRQLLITEEELHVGSESKIHPESHTIKNESKK